eukprot:3087471-Rhodomonas_salina.2
MLHALDACQWVGNGVGVMDGRGCECYVRVLEPDSDIKLGTNDPENLFLTAAVFAFDFLG